MASEPCSCGCSVVTSLSNAGQACSCGCDCCDPKVLTKEEEVAQLEALRTALDARLAELHAPVG